MNEPPNSDKRAADRLTKKGHDHSALFNYFQKHYKWIAIVCGLVVSLTLSLKDRFHERAKDYTSTIENARILQRMDSLSNATNGRIEVVGTSVRDVLEQIAITRKDAQSNLEAEVKAINNQGPVLGALLKDLLARGKSLSTFLVLVDKPVADDIKSNKIDLDLKIIALSNGPDVRKGFNTLQEFRHNTEITLGEIRKLEKKDDGLEEDIFKALESRRDRYER